MKHCSTFALLVILLSAGLSIAQEVRHQTLDPENNMIFLEIGVIAGVDEENRVIVEMVLPTESRPAENHGIDVRQGDRLIMMNGERLRSIADLRTRYEGVETGGEVKFAVGRDDNRFLVSFKKSDAESLESSGPGGRTAIRVVRGGPGGDVELLHEARALLRESDGTVRVDTVLQEGGELHQGDVVTAIDGEPVATLAAYREGYEAVALGETLQLTVRRGEESVAIELTKQERPAGMMVRSRQP